MTVETSTSPDALPTDGWGSSAMVYALVEGLAGIVEKHKLFQNVLVSPRWLAAGRNEAKVCTVYGASGASFEYSYAHDEAKRTFELELRGNASVNLHLLLPRGMKTVQVDVNGKKTKHFNTKVENSSYVDASFVLEKEALVRITYVPARPQRHEGKMR